ncbi:MAG: hypothetical protein DI535_01140 [Citrobacter freundii]|nr:MAG: hypothetical protein DI535_01140 [Citrobacter freundii]
MKKHLLSFVVLATLFTTVLSGCSKDDDNNDPGETKTQLLIKSNWKLEKVEASIIGDVTSQFEACEKDNTITFAATSNDATSGSGTLDEGPTKCDNSDPQSASFTWELITNGTVLRTSQALIDGGSTDFTIVSLNGTNLVLSQQMTIAPFGATTITLTLKH